VAELVERYALAVFPIPPGARRSPLPRAQSRCLSDPEEIRRVWVPGDNVGVGCRASWIVGLDLDRHGEVFGVATFGDLCRRHGREWPHTLTVHTPHDGLHMYFRVPKGRPVASSSGGWVGPGIDVRGTGRYLGGYLLGPGSVVDGKEYVIVQDAEILDLPVWLTHVLRRAEARRWARPRQKGGSSDTT
jgi:Bifunctional DNA primase/polymerase, N-terminal